MSETTQKNENNALLDGERLLAAVRGSLVGTAKRANAIFFTSVATDSRNVVEDTLFVPLVGEKQDGHAYIPQGLANGASVVFVARGAYQRDGALYERLAQEHPAVAFVVVEHTLRALQDAAAAYVAQFPRLIKCAVTGSSGKTTTKEIAVALLRQKYKVVTNEGNLNSETGLPLSVFAIRPEHEVGLFEMGMNRRGEIAELAAVLKPNFAIVTNIGTAHVGLLGSRQAIADEKKQIFAHVGTDGVAVIPAQDDFADFLADGVKGTVVRYGTDGVTSGIRILHDDGLDGTTLCVDDTEMRLPLPGTYNALNALAAIALARALGVSAVQMKAGIESVRPLGARSRIVRAANGVTILADCYNANPDSMEKAIAFCTDVQIQGKKYFILGDMLELGDASCAAHKRIGEMIARSDADMAIFVGAEMRSAYDEAVRVGSITCDYVTEYGDDALAAVARNINAVVQPGDLILLKGSHGIGLERLVPLLTGQSVEACA
ncbi:MAG: UDP-N-acetylmuramoyl-tripeptide--D-alanyl-D-alanine ligase [Treponema sp.]|nr:UDP-N-acetylmuramoyl-tripeptide--D-alanyl-D-alanine ligase [Treponema sp.]